MSDREEQGYSSGSGEFIGLKAAGSAVKPKNGKVHVWYTHGTYVTPSIEHWSLKSSSEAFSLGEFCWPVSDNLHYLRPASIKGNDCPGFQINKFP